MICPDFEHLFYPILNAVRISPDFEQLSDNDDNNDNNDNDKAYMRILRWPL